MIRINLLPVREERRKADVRQQALLLVLSLVFALVVVGVTHWMLLARISGTQTRIAQLDAELANYAEELAKVEEYRTKKADIETKLGVIQGLERARSGPVHVLEDLSVHAPDRLWLEKLDAENGVMTIEGLSLDNERVAAFLTSLEKSEYFGVVELKQTEFNDQHGLKLAKFRIEAGLTLPEESASGAADGGAPADPAAAPAGAGAAPADPAAAPADPAATPAGVPAAPAGR
jgi:type IV pilus assembly protein PilN